MFPRPFQLRRETGTFGPSIHAYLTSRPGLIAFELLGLAALAAVVGFGRVQRPLHVGNRAICMRRRICSGFKYFSQVLLSFDK